ncbi:hypothetical protein [Roseicyclus elongatus]|uniref:hypothetical protein n=1 Tax=Roseicyclus elongatus TaxID=159346 RepID=UPI0012EC0E31|nr:hypothetical protein [Roseibacterium elongatum]
MANAYSSEQLIQARIILLALDQSRRLIPMEANRTIVRAVVGNILNSLINENIGKEGKYGAKPDARFMSKRFFEEWSKCPTQGNLRAVGTYEHKTPMTILERKLSTASNEYEILNIIRQNAFCMWVTKAEDTRLNELGLKSSLPETGDRYAEAGIEIYSDGPVFYKGKHRGLSAKRDHKS